MAENVKPQFLTNYINGQFQIPSLFRELINPRHESVVCQVQESEPKDVIQAIEAAKDAFRGEWSEFDGSQRRDRLFALSEVILQHSDKLAQLESLNTGKPLEDARGEIGEVAECFKFFAGIADKIHAKSFSQDKRYHSYTQREALGVCALITSFNYPLVLLAWKLAPALATGNVVITKPAPQTPLTSLYLAHLIDQNQILPKGVFNVVLGGKQVGEILSNHSDIAKCSFTGSTQVGRKILESSASSNLKRVTLELGGKSPVFVLADSDFDLAVSTICDGIFSNCGQNCCAISKVYVEEPIYDRFLAAISQEAKAYQPHPDQSSSKMGPLIDSTQFNRVLTYIEEGKKVNQTKLLVGGSRAGQRGYYVEPTIFHDVDETSILAREEIFGPVLCVMKPFTSIDQAIEISNRSSYGLAAGIFSSSVNTVLGNVPKIKAGYVWVNCYNFMHPYLPFGGFKQSGMGKDLGAEAIDEFTNLKSVIIGLQ